MVSAFDVPWNWEQIITIYLIGLILMGSFYGYAIMVSLIYRETEDAKNEKPLVSFSLYHVLLINRFNYSVPL